MRKPIVIIVILNLLLILGCNKEEEVSRYPAIAIPQYSTGDYYRLLSDKNPEIVYNAVCNLSEDAVSIASVLSDKESDKNSENYIRSLNVFRKILQLLESKDEKIIASSLRFLQLFSANYDKQGELIEPVLKINSSSINVQYEQVIALSRVTSKDSKIDEVSLRKFLNHKSWLVSRAAYSLINSLEDARIRMDLIKKYKSGDNEFEKLLILTALENNFSDYIFEFLAGEMLSTASDKIKTRIFRMLKSAQDKAKVLSWLDNNYEKLTQQDLVSLAGCYGRSYDDFSASLSILLIKKGLIPDTDFLKHLSESITEYQNKKELSAGEKNELNNMLNIEREILANNILRDKWLSLKPPEPQINKQMQEEYDNAVDQFVAKSGEIFKKYNLDDEKKKSFLESLSLLKEGLVSELKK
ncbi:MAG: hypothetical protein V2A64_02885 [Candidatus Omnitrophota bacterium]